MEWGSVTFQKDGVAFTLSLDEVAGEEVKKQRELVEACETIEDLWHALSRGGLS